MFKHRNLTSDNEILWVRGEIAPEEQFLPFPTTFLIHISNYRSLITYSFVKFGCAICIFLSSENLICLSTDISKCFRGSLQLRDNESRLYHIKIGRLEGYNSVDPAEVAHYEPPHVDHYCL